MSSVPVKVKSDAVYLICRLGSGRLIGKHGASAPVAAGRQTFESASTMQTDIDIFVWGSRKEADLTAMGLFGRLQAENREIYFRKHGIFVNPISFVLQEREYRNKANVVYRLFAHCVYSVITDLTYSIADDGEGVNLEEDL